MNLLHVDIKCGKHQRALQLGRSTVRQFFIIKTNSGEMQGDERNNTALKSTYGSIQNNELHQAMQTGTVPSELTGENKESKTIYINIIFNTNFT